MYVIMLQFSSICSYERALCSCTRQQDAENIISKKGSCCRTIGPSALDMQKHKEPICVAMALRTYDDARLDTSHSSPRLCLPQKPTGEPQHIRAARFAELEMLIQ